MSIRYYVKKWFVYIFNCILLLCKLCNNKGSYACLYLNKYDLFHICKRLNGNKTWMNEWIPYFPGREMPLMWRYGYTPPPPVSVRRGKSAMGMDERTDCWHEENGPKMDRGRMSASSSISIMAPTATQSGAMDTSDICDVPFETRKGYHGGTTRLYKGTHVETVPQEGPSKTRLKLP
jgi:hypothetical protein